jgi:uncharacterized membrane protein YdjX (TVP38/TMEM64 family)
MTKSRPKILLFTLWSTVIGLAVYIYLFGPWLGILLTIIGENISANISFWLKKSLFIENSMEKG